MPNNAMFQFFVRRSNTTIIHVPNQIIPFICVFIITNTPTYLLVGFALGYMIIHKRTSAHLALKNNTEEQRRMESPLSLIFSDDIQHTSVNHYPPPTVHDNEFISETKTNREDDEEMSNGSLEFEKLMQFPPCPTTLPRLETQFNFKADYHQQMNASDPSQINWPAIHQELEYDRQRQQDDQQNQEKQAQRNSPQPSLFITPDHQDIDFLSSSSSSDDGQEETRSLCSFHANNAVSTADDDAVAASTIQIARKSTPVTTNNPVYLTTALPHVNKTTNKYNTVTTAAILLVENEVEEKINNETNLFEELLLSPAVPCPPKPSFSSPGQLFKSKFQSAVKKMKKPSLQSEKKERFVVNSKRSSAYCTNNNNLTDPPVATKKKARSLQIQAYFPSPSTSSSSHCRNSISLSPRSSASSRVHDHFKVQLKKLFKN